MGQIPDNYALVQTDTDAQAVAEYVGNLEDGQPVYTYYLVLQMDGEYIDVWGCNSLRLSALATRVWLDGELLV